MRRSLLLCSWLTNEFAKFTNRQNQSVQLRLICIYVCPTSAHRGFRYGIDVTKIILLPWKPLCFAGKVWFKVRFNIIKYKYAKEFHFCVAFLTNKFVLSMIIRIFAALVLAKPLNNAQIVRGVFVYTHLNMANLIPFLNLQKASLICLNREVYWFAIEIKPYSTLTTLVITDCLLICILYWRCPKQHICTRKVQHSKRWWCFIALTRNWDCSCSTR